MVWSHDASGVRTTAPHDILGQPFARHLPAGEGSEPLVAMIERSRDLFRGAAPAEACRRSGSGARASRPASSRSRHGGGACAAPWSAPWTSRAASAASSAGRRSRWTGATGNTDTNFRGKGAAGVAALADHDLVCVHIEAPDEAGHRGEWQEKVRSLEEIDRAIVAPLLDALAPVRAVAHPRDARPPDALLREDPHAGRRARSRWPERTSSPTRAAGFSEKEGAQGTSPGRERRRSWTCSRRRSRGSARAAGARRGAAGAGLQLLTALGRLL